MSSRTDVGGTNPSEADILGWIETHAVADLRAAVDGGPSRTCRTGT